MRGLVSDGKGRQDNDTPARLAANLACPFKLLQGLAQPAVLKQCRPPLLHRPLDDVLLPIEKRGGDRVRVEAVRCCPSDLGQNELRIIVFCLFHFSYAL